jgi:hypothetical protein
MNKIQFSTILICFAILMYMVANIPEVMTVRTEDEAVTRLLDTWDRCGGYPEVKVDVAKNEFLFYCQRGY